MTRIEFTEEEIEKLRYERFHHPHPRVQLKMEALLLKSQGLTVTNDAYINATTVCELLSKIAQANVGVPISLILDNARYQKCAVVRELAESLKIELVYLPSYSPNLNLIERFWKFIKKQVLYSKYYADFGAFSKAISNCISLAHTKHKKELDSLLTLRFQTFDQPQVAPAEFPALASG